jgi:hypothetical protein
MRIQWWPRARIRLLSLTRADAERIDRSVQDWADNGTGQVIYLEGAYRLIGDGFVVVFFVDGDVLHVSEVLQP